MLSDSKNADYVRFGVLWILAFESDEFKKFEIEDPLDMSDRFLDLKCGF